MKVPKGYCDLRVERITDDILKTFIKYGYSTIAVNTTVNCSLLDVGTSNKKKRKISEVNDENNQDLIPIPKPIKEDIIELTILNRLTIQITNIGQLQKVVSSQNFKYYDILAVEPLNDKIIQNLVTSPSVDILCCNTKIFIGAKDYNNAVAKQIYFEITYAPMLNNSIIRQETITLAHLFHIKGKSKNVIVTSKAVNKLDVRNPYDIINIGFILGLSNNQSKEAIARTCHSIILKSYGRKVGKSAIHMIPAQKEL